MLDLGTTEFVLAVPSLPEANLKRLSTSLFDAWDSYVDSVVSLPDYSLSLQVEEGSVKGVARISAMAGVLYLAIGNYGDFISGVKTISEQISATSEFLSERAKQTFNCPDAQAASKKRGGAIGGLQRLFVRVQKGELSPDEAVMHAERLLGDQQNEAPGLMTDLANAFRDCPKQHKQEEFPFESLSEDLLMANQSGPPPTRKAPRPSIDLAPALQLRIEVWRESKKNRRKTRVVKL